MSGLFYLAALELAILSAAVRSSGAGVEAPGVAAAMAD